MVKIHNVCRLDKHFVQKLWKKSIKTKLLKNVIQGTYKFFLRYKRERERGRDEKREMEKTDSQSPEKAEWLAFLKHEQLFKNQCIVIKAEDCSLGEQVLIYACAHRVSTGPVICFQTYVKYGGVLQ